MVKTQEGEFWKELPFDEGACQKRYAISNYGRLVSFINGIEVDGRELKVHNLKGYSMITSRCIRKTHAGYVHKLVAKFFLEKESENQEYVLHKDFDKSNNCADNLKFATKEEMFKHNEKNPNVIKARREQRGRQMYQGHKLNQTQVKRLKKKIMDPNRKTRLKMIAKQFGISEMQLYRIKSGENWGHVNPD